MGDQEADAESGCLVADAAYQDIFTTSQVHMIDLATAVSVRIIDHQGERASGIFPVDRQRDIRGSRCLAEENSLRLHGLIDQPVVYQDRHIGTFIKKEKCHVVSQRRKLLGHCAGAADMGKINGASIGGGPAF